MRFRRIVLALPILAMLICTACTQADPPAITTQTPGPGEPGVRIYYNFQRQSSTASNQYAIWIEDMDGNLVKTLCATEFTAKGGWKNRPDSLSTWVSKARGKTDFDAVATATPKESDPEAIYSCWWDLTDESGNTLPSGTYRFFLEGTLRWKNHVIYSGVVEVGGPGNTVHAAPEYFFAGEGGQPALDDNSSERNMIGGVWAN